MKIVKGNKTYPVITGNDVIVTKGSKSLQTVDDAINNQQKEIDKLKSNMKYLYSYGGVGGNGSGGGNGSSSTTASPSLVVTLANKTLNNGNSPLVLGKTGTYTLNVSVRDNINAETFYLRIGYGLNVDNVANSRIITLSPPCKYSTDINLSVNGEVTIMWYDSNVELIDIVSQHYIVTPHTFDVAFKYTSKTGNVIPFSKNNTYFMGSSDVLDPFIDMSYRIDLAEASGVGITYSISNTDLADGVKFENLSLNDNKKIYLKDITKNGNPLISNENMGSYNVNVNLTYSINGNAVSEDKSFKFTLIPNDLYIDVRNPQNIMYNTFNELVNSKKNNKDGNPDLYTISGSYSSFYVKVYEGQIGTNTEEYAVSYKIYNYVDSGDGEYDESNFEQEPYFTSDKMTVDEQVESPNPFFINFSSPGIKRIVFETKHSENKPYGNDNPTIKYVYVKERVSEIKTWSPAGNIRDYYFRANNNDNTYSDNFPKNEKFGNLPWELSAADANSYTISDSVWGVMDDSQDTTIMSIGFQYSKVNSEGAEILRTYSTSTSTTIDFTLYSNRLFGSGGEICLPYENTFNKSIREQYHLLQIIRSSIVDPNSDELKYATYLYIDGVLESVKTSTDKGKWFIGKIVLNNVNIAYNLINIQYLQRDNNTIDGLAYHYWLKYKSDMMGKNITPAEKTIFDNMSKIYFDGTNVVMEDESVLKSIVNDMPIPVMMMSYSGKSKTIVDGKEVIEVDEDADNVENLLFMGHPNGDSGFGTRKIDLYWSDPIYSWRKISVPTMHSTLTAEWTVELQGTSTMRNRIKNFTLGLQTSNNEAGEKILVSPNYDADNFSTFLPENKWTLKADIADSAHANNTSIGKFVNKVCTKFVTGQNHPGHIKNALEGFPVLMFFQIGKKVYYFGVYNFNMGRNSYYNLGYYTAEDTNNMLSNIYTNTESYGPFVFSYGSAQYIDNLSVVEIQDNQPQFGFHQYNKTVLFQDEKSEITKMFGKSNKMTYGGTYAKAESKVLEFVKSVSKAGAYCFANIGKQSIPSMKKSEEGEINWDESNPSAADGFLCDDKYTVKNQVPDARWQMRYDADDNITWQPDGFLFDDVKDDVDNLFRCICKQLSGGETNVPYLDFTSASEYYTICMAFAMVDSVCKNMNIKSWNEKTNYIAFYDMDCGFGEDNSGDETVSYLAAMDYWHSDEKNGSLGPVSVDWDYWNNSIGTGFDAKSSYLFAIVKYAQALLGGESKYGVNLTNYPQQFWAQLRNPKGDKGELKNAEHFINNYFISGIGQIPPYLASLNYQVKYLYTGTILKDDGTPSEPINLALSAGFHGSRVFKVKDWLKKRLNILDMMFNVQGIEKEIYSSGKVYTPKADEDTLNALKQNIDISLLQSAFSSDTQKTACISGSFYVKVKAPMNTPVVIKDGSSSMMYILTKGLNNKDGNDYNILYLQPTNNQSYEILGSKEFIDMNIIDPVITKYYSIVSNNLENVTYGNSVYPPLTTSSFSIISTSLKNISLNIPNFNAELNIDNTKDSGYGQSITKLDVSNSGFYGEWKDLQSLKELNISSVNAPGESIIVNMCKMLRGEKCTISGTQEKPTSLKKLSIHDVSGVFDLTYTSIETIDFSANDGEDAEFYISDNPILTTLTISGFKKISIRNCPNLSSLSIVDTEKNKCESIEIDLAENYTEYIDKKTKESKLLRFNSVENGIFDFTKYTNLKELGVSGCYGVEVIKIPNHKVSIKKFSNNYNLEFIDTTGENSCIELTQSHSFYMSPKYGMKQSWGSLGNKPEYVEYTEGDGDEQKVVKYGIVKKPAYTKMCVSEDCTDLSNTFNKEYTIESKYLYDNTNQHPYTNTQLNLKVYNTNINGSDVKWFLNTVVANGRLDDIHIDENGNIIDGENSNDYYESGNSNCCGNIVTLQACFKYQSGINYSKPNNTIGKLNEYTSLVNINEMYNKTNVDILTSELLSLPSELNKVKDDEGNPIPTISWDLFVKSGEIKITKNALANISYRITSLNMLMFKVVGNSSSTSDAENYSKLVNTDGSTYLDILDVLNKKEGKTFDNMTSITMFSIDSSQYVDYSGLFDYCPNVIRLESFLNCDLSRAKLKNNEYGLLYPCKKLEVISNSLNHTGDIENAPEIDLYTFFDWENNKDIYSLFTTTGVGDIGFKLKKTISNINFKNVLKYLIDYNHITSLMNIFSYCTINDYDGSEIILGESNDGKVMEGITNINSLFFKCKGIANNTNVPLKITRKFFEKLPNVTTLMHTFNSVYFADMLSLDFFCKREEFIDHTIKIYDGGYKDADLKTYTYRNNISSLYGCFDNAKFVNCRCWFDPTDAINNGLMPENDKIFYGDSEYIGKYYKVSYGNYIEYNISNSDVKKDTLYNFTNIESENIHFNSSGNESITILNHDVDKDLSTFGNKGEEGTYPYIQNDFGIYPTYCCLPPDILYGCSDRCDLTRVFANTNIIGVIPQHLLKNCNSGIYESMLCNTNILPNVYYNYDDYTKYKDDKGNQKYNIQDYLNLIKDVPVLDGSDSENAIVLFRNDDGELQRRCFNEEYDRKISQYVYIPDGYTRNTNLKKAFNFRYNLPENVDLYSDRLMNTYEIIWARGSYGIDYSPDSRPDLWPHYNQYFFMSENSVDWQYVYDMSNPFINDDEDVEFKEGGKSRVFSSTDNTANKWWDGTENIDKNSWFSKTDGVLNIFLNLCGEKKEEKIKITDENGNEVEETIKKDFLTDCGCKIKKAIDRDNNPQINKFIGGNLCTFLNGQVLDCSGYVLSSANGSKIIAFDKFGRNIIFPNLETLPDEKTDTLVILSFNRETSQFYNFMFIGSSMQNYKERYFKDAYNIVVNENAIKYKVR